MERVAALWVGGTSEVTLGAARLVIVLALLAPPTRHWFLDAGFRWSYIVVVAFTVSLFLVPLVRRYAIWREVLDQPAARKVHMVATPLLGGAGVYLAFAITVLANFRSELALLAPPTRHWFLDAGFRWSYIVVVAFTVSLFLVPLVRRYAIWREVLDQPAARKVHMVATPLLGGAGVYLAFAITVLANFHFSMTLKGVALGASVVVALGILDDVADLPAWVKLLGQIGGASLPLPYGGGLSGGPLCLKNTAADSIPPSPP